MGLFEPSRIGRLTKPNPDLVARFRRGAALNSPDEARFYSGADAGYIDYPTLGSACAERCPTSVAAE